MILKENIIESKSINMKKVLIFSIFLFFLTLIFIPIRYCYYKDHGQVFRIRYEFILGKHDYLTTNKMNHHRENKLYIEYYLIYLEWLFIILANFGIFLIKKKIV